MFLALRSSSNLRQPAIRPESRFLPIPHLHSTPPLGGFPSEYHHPVWCGKTSMVWLPDSEKISKICLFVFTWSTNVTDRQTDTAWRHRPLLCIASRGKNAAILEPVRAFDHILLPQISHDLSYGSCYCIDKHTYIHTHTPIENNTTFGTVSLRGS